jgi:2-succinyl-5-enolpyruvyl-6-hydroxy-3-cyclohexene-1-carboxylate synthase
MPVRVVEWYGATRPGLRVLANRGANGIDGVVSTAVGVALAATESGVDTAVLVGDVAFLHDANALVGLAARQVRLVIVVVDNDGGGIFSFLPQAETLDPATFERLFGTPHGVDLAALAGAHGIATTEVASASELRATLAEAAARGGVRVVRVRTDRRSNVAAHDAIHDAVAAALAALC